MTIPWLISYVLLWAIVLGISFFLLGTLRSLGLLQWKFDEMAAIRPVRKGREGLAPGQPAPDFTLPGVENGDVSLHDFAGHELLLVFTQSGCGPCHRIAPELNRLQENEQHQILVVNNGEHNETQAWADEVQAAFPIVSQNEWEISKKYQVFATPYAFVIDEQGMIAAKGMASTPQYIHYIFDAAKKRKSVDPKTSDRDSTVEHETNSSPTSKEVIHA